jgi:two-component system, NarL family, nitrate/nitrite response regulator NarL
VGQILAEGGFDVVGNATSGLQVAPLVARSNPDLVLLDVAMPGLDGLSCLSLLRERHPQVSVVLLTGSQDADTIERALALGASAYVAKSIDPLDLPAVLRQALEGNVYYTTPRVRRDAVVRLTLERDQEQVRRETGLSPRELEILASVSKGLSNRAIGKELFVSEQTVKFHLQRIYRKLGVANRTEATRIAHQLGVAPELAAG